MKNNLHKNSLSFDELPKKSLTFEELRENLKRKEIGYKIETRNDYFKFEVNAALPNGKRFTCRYGYDKGASAEVIEMGGVKNGISAAYYRKDGSISTHREYSKESGLITAITHFDKKGRAQEKENVEDNIRSRIKKTINRAVEKILQDKRENKKTNTHKPL